MVHRAGFVFDEKFGEVEKDSKSKTKDVQNDADKLLKSSDPTQETRLRHQLVKLQQRLEDIDKVDEAILNISEDEDEIENEIRDDAQFRDFIYDTVVTTELVLKRFENKTMQPKTYATVTSSFSTK